MQILETANEAVLAIAVTGLGAVAAYRLASVVRLPAPVLFLSLGLIVSALWHVQLLDVDALSMLPLPEGPQTPRDRLIDFSDLSILGTIALVVILFEGGYHCGWKVMRASLGPVLGLGVVGTAITAGALAAVAHGLLGFAWTPAVLIGIALAPTDPAAVFSVLGGRQIPGRSDSILKGESGANDPVAISFMLAAIAWFSIDGASSARGVSDVLHVGSDVAIEFAVAVIVGLVAGGLRSTLSGRVRIGPAPLHAMASIGMAFGVYSLTVALHGSGFLAVFILGLLAGDVEASERETTDHVLVTASMFAEFAMFTALGITFIRHDLEGLIWPGIALLVVLTLVVRPVAVFALLAPSALTRREQAFISWGGLKGAVPILLATFPALAAVDGAASVYGTVFVAVAGSMLVQGATLGVVARRLGIVA